MEQGKSLASSTFKGQKSSENEKLTASIGTGKEFDALVTTLKTAIKDGLIDKENLHRLSHGLGVKPEELASMVGVDKDNVEALDQDEAPEVHTQLPDTMEPKTFKEFRAETFGSTESQETSNVAEGTDSIQRAIELKSRTLGKSGNILNRVKRAVTSFSGINQRVSKLTNPLRKAELTKAEAGATLGGKITTAGRRVAKVIQNKLRGINLKSRSGLLQAKKRVGSDPQVQRAEANANPRVRAEAEQIRRAITGS